MEEPARRLALTPAPAAALRNLRREVTLYFLSDDELDAAAGAGEEELLSEDLLLVLPDSLLLLDEDDSFASELELERSDPECSEDSPFFEPPLAALLAPLA
jgi:hypothetical protein